MEKSKKKDFEFATVMLRKTSVYSASFLNKFNITPNQITIFRFLIFGLGAVYCFFRSTYLFNIIGVILLFLNHYSDLVDGDLARTFNKKSELGKFLEELLDPILLSLIVLVITSGLFSDSSPYKYGGLTCLFGLTFSLRATLYFKNNFNIDCVESNDILEDNLKNKKIDFFSFFVKELITPKNFIMSLFSNIRSYLIVGAFIGVMPIAISLYAIAINVRWIILSIFLLILNSNLSIKGKIILAEYINKLKNGK